MIILYKSGYAWLWCYNLLNDAFFDCQEGYYRLNEDDAEKWAYLADLINATKDYGEENERRYFFKHYNTTNDYY